MERLTEKENVELPMKVLLKMRVKLNDEVSEAQHTGSTPGAHGCQARPGVVLPPSGSRRHYYRPSRVTPRLLPLCART